MPLQKLVHSIESPLQGEVAKFPYLNQIIDYCNNLEKRLDVLEGKRCACSKIGGVCPTHYVK